MVPQPDRVGGKRGKIAVYWGLGNRIVVFLEPIGGIGIEADRLSKWNFNGPYYRG